jgi:hypothetical protein
MRNIVRVGLAAATALLIPLAVACAGNPVADRQGPAGTQPDGFQDMTHVIVYRAPDQVPNIAVGCLGPYGFMTTLKNTSGGSSGSGSAAPSLARFPEYDKTCAA